MVPYLQLVELDLWYEFGEDIVRYLNDGTFTCVLDKGTSITLSN